MIESEDFQNAMTLPLGPTNTFVLLQKSDTNQISEFFIPKPQYTLPAQASCFRIRFEHSEDIQLNCYCPGLVDIFYDSRNEYHIENNYSTTFNELNYSKPSESYQWYQSREVIKGFKFIR